jgi:pyruvate dehydrogenase E2 component (dihydrolipoamide acetyltransferase)
MSIEVLMPLRGAEDDEIRIVRWLKTVGDVVAAGDAIVEIETAKTIEEIGAPGSGVLREILLDADSRVVANTPIARIDVD